jgi:hypothetical protein
MDLRAGLQFERTDDQHLHAGMQGSALVLEMLSPARATGGGLQGLKLRKPDHIFH